MKFALFYEIPVARPWTPGKEHQAYKNTIEQAVLGDQMGFHAFWTVEHHFLEEYSHCSNPEVLYGAVAARTENIRIGYGVRLLPKPYNHPIRTAESVAVLDLISDGRVDFGTGRSSTRAELEGFDIDPDETREQWREALEHIVERVDEDEYQADGKYWQMGAPRRVLPEAAAAAAPADLRRHEQLPAATRRSASAASGCARSPSGCRPSSSPRTSRMYRKGLAECTQPAGKFLNDTAATFTMVHCAPTNEEATEVAKESFEWYPKLRRRTHRVGRRVAGGAGQHRRSAPTSTRATRCSTSGTASWATSRIDYLRDSGSRGDGRPRRVHRGGQAVRGGRLRPAPVPGEPVQHPAREGHAVDRAAWGSTCSPSSRNAARPPSVPRT